MILARSPYYIMSPTVTPGLNPTFDSFDIDLFIWKGDKVADKPSTPTYQFSIPRPSTDVQRLSKNISPYIEDFFLNETVTPFNGVAANNQDNIVWVEWDGRLINDSLSRPDVVGIDFATNGYTEYLEGVNSDSYSIITNANQNEIANKKILDTGLLILPILNGDKTIKVNGSVFETLTESQLSSEQIRYIRIDASNYQNKIDITVEDGGIETESYSYDLVCENKFDPTNIVFKNKWGAYENIYFFKKPTQSIKTESTEFLNNASGGLPYNTTKHQFKKFGLQSKKTLKAMTGYVSDLINPNIEQLVLSENVFIQTENDLIPINVKTESLEFQTQLVDKKVNYEFEFEYAYNQINSM